MNETDIHSSDDQSPVLIGVDLGGTKIMAGAFDKNLKLLGRNKIRTKAERGFANVTERIARCIRELLEDNDIDPKRIQATGIGTPGSTNTDGNVIFAGNLGWENVPLKSRMESLLNVPVSIGNDCNLATLGIYHKELEAKPSNIVGIFLGTGVGAGLILNKRLYRGSNLIAGEIGHIVMDVNGEKCNCGNRGCLELFTSRGAIFQKIETAIVNGEKTIIEEMANGDLKDLRSRDLLKAINKGDKCVERIVKHAAQYTGIAVGNIINLLNPDVIVLGGGVIEALEDTMLPIIDKVAHEIAFPGIPRDFQVLASKLADDAGITGAAVLARGGDL